MHKTSTPGASELQVLVRLLQAARMYCCHLDWWYDSGKASRSQQNSPLRHQRPVHPDTELEE